MATNFCEKCRAEHPGRECDYDPATGTCAETNASEFSDEPIGTEPMSKIGARKFYDALPTEKKNPAIDLLSKDLDSTGERQLLRDMMSDGPDWYVGQHFFGGMAVRNRLRAKGFGEKYWPIWNLDDIYVFLLEDAIKKEG